MSEFTGYGRRGDIDFGDYVQYPYCGEMHIYKVVNCLKSNRYQDPPDRFNIHAVLHGEVVDVLNIIHCGIDETKVIAVKKDDCKLLKGE